MKIYQLHAHSYDYEYSYDYIIGSYLKKERAEEEKTKAELEERELASHGKRCENCPFLEDDSYMLDKLMKKYHNYCPDAKLEENEEYGICCENYYLHWNESTFKIEEVEVEE